MINDEPQEKLCNGLKISLHRKRDAFLLNTQHQGLQPSSLPDNVVSLNSKKFEHVQKLGQTFFLLLPYFPLLLLAV